MAELIGDDGDGLAQIAAVTTGSFDEGLTRGDRVVINPEAWATLGALGRRVVLTHELTHVATRASSARSVPIWLSEGFADYVAYAALDVATTTVASDLLAAVRAGEGPRTLPDERDFDAARQDIAEAYEGAWLAARMLAERYGERRLVELYVELADADGGRDRQEIHEELGITWRQLTRQWRAYLADNAARS
jgi:hypothetical protein